MKLYKGDCLIESDKIESGSVDLILTDLPYGTIKEASKNWTTKNEKAHKWDNVIDTAKIYEIANRILRKNGKMVLFAQDPFSTELKTKALPNIPYNYSMIWEKNDFANALLSKKAPVNYYEDILVFSKNEGNLLQDYKGLHPLREYFYTEYEKTGLTYKEINRDYLETAFEGGGGMAYNMLCRTRKSFFMPTKEMYLKLQKTGFFKKPYDELKIIHENYHNKLKTDLYNKYPSTFNLWEGKKYKSNILKYKKDYDGHHPTQKPVLLLEDLIKTFSNENDLVVDLTMGSGSTGVACKNTNRKFIGIEMNDEYFKIAEQRINNTKYTLF